VHLLLFKSNAPIDPPQVPRRLPRVQAQPVARPSRVGGAFAFSVSSSGSGSGSVFILFFFRFLFKLFFLLPYFPAWFYFSMVVFFSPFCGTTFFLPFFRAIGRIDLPCLLFWACALILLKKAPFILIPLCCAFGLVFSSFMRIWTHLFFALTRGAASRLLLLFARPVTSPHVWDGWMSSHLSADFGVPTFFTHHLPCALFLFDAGSG
jgi:hypothetical protein